MLLSSSGETERNKTKQRKKKRDMKKAFDILLNGRPDSIIWATSEKAAIAAWKRLVDWSLRPNFRRAVKVTAAARIQEEVV